MKKRTPTSNLVSGALRIISNAEYSGKIILILIFARLIILKFVLKSFKGPIIVLECSINLLLVAKYLTENSGKNKVLCSGPGLNLLRTINKNDEGTKNNEKLTIQKPNDKKVAKLTSTKPLYSKKIEKLKDENDQLMKIIYQLLEENNFLKNKHQTIEEEKKVLNSEAAYYKNKSNLLKVENFELSANSRKHAGKLEAVVIENRILKRDIQNARETNNHHLKTLNSLYGKVHILRKQIDHKDSKLAYQNFIKIREDELNTKDQMIQSLKDSNENLQKELEGKLNDLLQLINQLSQLQSTNDTNKEEISKLEFKVDRLSGDNQRIRKERADTVDQLSALNDEVLRLNNELDYFSSMNKNMKDKSDKYQDEAILLSELNYELRQDNRKLSNELKVNITSKRQELAKLNEQITELSITNDTLQKQLEGKAKLSETEQKEQQPNEELIRERERLTKLLASASEVNKNYILRFSETKLSLKVKDLAIRSLQTKVNDQSEILQKLQTFITGFESKFSSILAVLRSLIPKYNEQRKFLVKLIQVVALEEKNFNLVNELKEKNFKFKKMLKNILEENLTIKNELEVKHEEIFSLRAQLHLKDEYITVLQYSSDNNLPEPASDNNCTKKETGFRKEYTQLDNDFQAKDIFINERIIRANSDLTLINEMSSRHEYLHHVAGQLPVLSKSEFSTSEVSNGSSSGISSINNEIEDFINIDLNDLVVSSADAEFAHKLSAYLKSNEFEELVSSSEQNLHSLVDGNPFEDVLDVDIISLMKSLTQAIINELNSVELFFQSETKAIKQYNFDNENVKDYGRTINGKHKRHSLNSKLKYGDLMKNKSEMSSPHSRSHRKALSTSSIFSNSTPSLTSQKADYNIFNFDYDINLSKTVPSTATKKIPSASDSINIGPFNSTTILENFDGGSPSKVKVYTSRETNFGKTSKETLYHSSNKSSKSIFKSVPKLQPENLYGSTPIKKKPLGAQLGGLTPKPKHEVNIIKKD